MTITKITAAATAATALLAGCAVPLTSSPATHTPPTITQAARSETPQRTFMPRSPGSGDGTWLVPNQIQPGTYRADQTSSRMGYVVVCADLACEIDADGSDYTGMIENYLVQGPEYIVVPSYAASVKTQRVTLTKVG